MTVSYLTPRPNSPIDWGVAVTKVTISDSIGFCGYVTCGDVDFYVCFRVYVRARDRSTLNSGSTCQRTLEAKNKNG